MKNKHLPKLREQVINIKITIPAADIMKHMLTGCTYSEAVRKALNEMDKIDD